MTVLRSSDDPRIAAGATERHVGQVRGTRDWLQGDYARLLGYERTLLDCFARAGYRPARTPVLELSDLHERKSGAGIVARLFEVSGAGTAGICLRPELTAGVVRAYVEADEPPPLPWRASVSGPVFRFQATGRGLDREFIQTGVELIGAGGPAADAEVIWLADWSLRALGAREPRIRIGHVGLILELLGGAGLPPAATSALIESLSEAASEGEGVEALEAALDRLTAWLGSNGTAEGTASSTSATPDPVVDRLFRHLVPDVTGRRSGGDIVGRLRRKWALEHTLHDALEKVRGLVHDLAALRGPAADVLVRLDRDFAARAPESVAAIGELADMLEHQGVDLDRVELDLGFGRGIGFYTQMIFELSAATPRGPVEVCGGGRYDGLARVLGGRGRDDRGAGFAFGLERLDQVLGPDDGRASRAKAPQGYLVTGGGRGVGREAAALAAFLRERLDLPVVVADLDIEDAVAYARGLGLDRIVTAGAEVELWNLEHGDVRSVREGELIDQIRGRLSVVRGDAR
ncbi:ATP phosphoribosyltransferase regulatory subunit [Paludisphaera mucosa]|uniref:Histidine--tRNA ligase n=1 Tax=Paludisphaera mucosa TaxID=3030827 RepID=A0ABT6FGQ2_9BACT|nr:ATP phosphoribosyltransferase regulatory subunit [Paludisphaera mucosa]MDG3006747.1 ATP phosphoribosyltransferase regulatory subunit [Paludisphaera mucosa]